MSDVTIQELAARAAALWNEDGIYDWDGGAEPYVGSAAVEAPPSFDDPTRV